MANRNNILRIIEDFNVETLVEFLDCNGLDEYGNVIRIKNIDGFTFLTLNDFQINLWRPHITASQGRKLSNFLTKLKSSPEIFYEKMATKQTSIPISDAFNKHESKSPNLETSHHHNLLSISSENLEKICKNEELINKLKSLLASRDKMNELNVEEENIYGNDEIATNSPMPYGNKPLLPKPIQQDAKPNEISKNLHESIDTEEIYEDPPKIPDELCKIPTQTNFQIGPLLPGRPSRMPAKFKAPPPPLDEPEDFTSSKTQQNQPTRPVKKPERELQAKFPPKISIIHTPVPPLPTESVNRRKIENKLEEVLNRHVTSVTNHTKSLPRPPKLIPKFVGSYEDGSIDNSIPSSYRYTDRKGSELLLTEDLGDGSYLLRPSRKFYCTLSLRYKKKIYHIGIKQLDDGILECESSFNNFHFKTLKEITSYFEENPLTVSDGKDNFHTVRLKDVLPSDRT